jgi:glyoxylase-like metal-dependent hydrolase (beta-lactamase superfamily II)
MKQIAPNIYVSTEYPYVNVGCVTGSKGVVAIDAPTLPEDALDWRRRILALEKGPIVYTAITDAHPHRLLCAGMLEAPIVASRAAYELAAEYSRGFWRNAVRRLRRYYPGQEAALRMVEPVLPEILFSDTLTLHKGGGNVTIERIEGAAPGSAWVDLREENVLFVGDTLVVGRPPVMDETPDTKAWLDTLTTLRRPRFSDVTFVPGRGPVSDQAATEPLSEYIRVARRRMRSLHQTGRSRDAVTDFTNEFLSVFSLSDEERDRYRRRVRKGLKHVYEELAPEEEESG